MKAGFINKNSSCTLTDLKHFVENGDSIAICAEADDVLENLSELKSRVSLVLIDPPYNRRTKFHHYSDSLKSKDWADILKSHCEKLKNLLSDDGSLWMHIDDAEMPIARISLDAIFGKNNFVASIVWQKTVSRDNRMAISTTHEYILVYAKNKSIWQRKRNKIPPTDDQLKRYKNRDNDIRGPWTSGDLTAKAGPGRRASQFYTLTTSSGRDVNPSPGTAWRFTKERMEELIKDNRIYFSNGNTMPRLKRFLYEVQPGLVPDTWWSGNDVGTADSAKRHLKSLFPGLVPFETPKPELLTSRIIQIATEPGELVIDIYGGSGTTSAVAMKMKRQWITCEREEQTFEEFLLPRLFKVCDGNDNDDVSKLYEWKGGSKFIVIN